MSVSDGERFRVLDHTGDLAVRLWGTGPRELLRSAGEALFHVIAGGASVEPRVSRDVQARGADLPEQVVAWMNRLLLLHQTEGLILCRFEPRNPRGEVVRGRVQGARPGPRLALALRELKAVTYHGLRIERDGERLSLTVVIDV